MYFSRKMLLLHSVRSRTIWLYSSRSLSISSPRKCISMVFSNSIGSMRRLFVSTCKYASSGHALMTLQ